MRTHHWLLLIGILLIMGGFFALAVAVVLLKFILWGIGVLFLIGAISGLLRNPR